jgi:peptide/nickel transport system permease protein
MLAIVVIAFAVKGALGDPLREIMGEAVPEAERAELRHQLGLDAPWPARYLGHAAQGDLGQSYIYKRPTPEVLLAKFPASFELVLAASLIVLLISLPAGMYCPVKPRSLGACLVLGLSVLGISVPVFLTGIILISIFSVRLGAPGLRTRRDGTDRFLGGWAAHPRRTQALSAAGGHAVPHHAAASLEGRR